MVNQQTNGLTLVTYRLTDRLTARVADATYGRDELEKKLANKLLECRTGDMVMPIFVFSVCKPERRSR